MDGRDSSPQSTLVILLGASQWPEFPDFHGSQAFVHVAADFSRYLLDPQHFGLPGKNFLNLFDTDLSPDKIDKEIRHFLDRRATELKLAGHGPTDLLFYFVGHGGFVGRNSEYYLAVRCTSSANPAVSGIRMEPLATTITERARYLRRLIILDCCYAAAAFTAFQAEGPEQVAIRQTVDLFKEKAKRVGKGTALLCSSGKKVPSLLTPAEDSTMFSNALLHVLSIRGNPYRPEEAYLSLREVADLTEEVLGSMLDEQAPRPELHSPDQVDGDVAEVPFFPNPIMKAVKASQSSMVWSRQDEIARYATTHLPHPSPPHVNLPAARFEPKRVRLVVSRRTVLVGLAGLVVAGVAGGGLLWLERSQQSTALYTYRGHSKAVRAVAWSPNGKRIASGSGDKTVQVWDAINGGHVYIYRGHSNAPQYGVLAVAWSPDGKCIASGSDDRTVQVWDAANGGHVFTYRGHSDYVSAVTWSPDGKRIASGSGGPNRGGDDHTVQVWDAADGGHVFTYRGHSDYVSAVTWSPDGKRIASGSDDKTVQVWNAADGGHAFTYRGHTYAVSTVAWSPDGKRIASADDDGTVQVWDATNGGNVYTYWGHSVIVYAVAWSPDGKRIASGSGDHTVQVWDAMDGGHVYTYRGHSSIVLAVTWSPDGKDIASGSGDPINNDNTVQVWVAG